MLAAAEKEKEAAASKMVFVTPALDTRAVTAAVAAASTDRNTKVFPPANHRYVRVRNSFFPIRQSVSQSVGCDMCSDSIL